VVLTDPFRHQTDPPLLGIPSPMLASAIRDRKGRLALFMLPPLSRLPSRRVRKTDFFLRSSRICFPFLTSSSPPAANYTPPLCCEILLLSGLVSSSSYSEPPKQRFSGSTTSSSSKWYRGPSFPRHSHWRSNGSSYGSSELFRQSGVLFFQYRSFRTPLFPEDCSTKAPGPPFVTLPEERTPPPQSSPRLQADVKVLYRLPRFSKDTFFSLSLKVSLPSSAVECALTESPPFGFSPLL